MQKTPSVQTIAQQIKLIEKSLPEALCLSEAKRLQKIWGQIRDLTLVVDKRSPLTPVINGTGILLHTGLGRAPLAPVILERLRMLSNYVSLEISLDSGLRGSRTAYLDRLFQNINPLYKPVWVGNGAAAILLTLKALKLQNPSRPLIMSRGEMVEIGGGFRIPEIMSESGFEMIEVGTTNKTRMTDFELALKKHKKAVICRVHPSNFTMQGFTHTVPPEELIPLSQKTGTPLLFDAGTLTPDEIRKIPKGFTAVTLSCDKSMGGPQGGLIMTTPELQALILKNPLYRALRIDKLNSTALEVFFELVVEKKDRKDLPLLTLRGAQGTLERARKIISLFKPGFFSAVPCEAAFGGGSIEKENFPSAGIEITLGKSANSVVDFLRKATPALLISVKNRHPFVNLGAVFPEQDVLIEKALDRLIVALDSKLL